MKKEYIIRVKNSQAYIRNIDSKSDTYTFDIQNAKKYEKENAENIIKNRNDEFEIVDFNKELYKIKNERFKIFVKTLALQENTTILDEDIELFEKEVKIEGITVACCNLNDKYPTNRLLSEMERISQKIEFKTNCKKRPEEYKSYKDISESYDYDDEREFEILKLAFYEKYITKEIIDEIEIQEQ